MIKDNKGLITLVIAIIALSVAVFSGGETVIDKTQTIREQVGGAVDPSGFTELKLTPNKQGSLGVVQGMVKLRLLDSSNAPTTTDSWVNDTGADVWATAQFVMTDTTQTGKTGNVATTTDTKSLVSYIVEVATSTVAIPATGYGNFTDYPSNIIDNFSIPSGQNTSVNSLNAATSTLVTRMPVLVKSAEYVFFQMRQATTSPCAGVSCETATSTNMGFTPELHIFYNR